MLNVDVNFALITNVGDVEGRMASDVQAALADQEDCKCIEQTPELPTNHNDSFLVFKHDRRNLAALKMHCKMVSRRPVSC